MKIHTLPTLDGSVEAAVARLEAWERRCTVEAFDAALDEIGCTIGDLQRTAESPDGRQRRQVEATALRRTADACYLDVNDLLDALDVAS